MKDSPQGFFLLHVIYRESNDLPLELLVADKLVGNVVVEGKLRVVVQKAAASAAMGDRRRETTRNPVIDALITLMQVRQCHIAGHYCAIDIYMQ